MSYVYLGVMVALGIGVLLLMLILFWSLPAALLRWDRRAVLTAAIWAVGLGGTVLASGVQPVGLSAEGRLAAVEFSGTVGLASLWAKRLLTGGILFVSVGLIFRQLILRDWPRSGGWLLGGYLTFFILEVGASSALGTEPAFVAQLWYVPIVLIAVWFAPRVSVEWLSVQAKYVVLVVLTGSVCSALVAPDLVFWRTHNTVIPGIAKRLAGLTAHPNALGPIALFFLILEFYFPSRKAIRWIGITVALAALLLSQSKTAFICGAVIAAVLLAQATTIVIRRAFAGDRLAATAAVTLIGAGLLAITALVVFVMFGGPPERLGWALVQLLPNIGTLTGRTEIWEITLDLWRRNPWFGYGPELWSPEFRTAQGLLYVGQAHNQYIQTLGDSGLLGLLGLTIYLGVLTIAAIAYRHASRGLTVVVLALILARTMTETPFRSLGIVDSSFFLHFYLFTLLLTMCDERPSLGTYERSTQPQSDRSRYLLPQSM